MSIRPGFLFDHTPEEQQRYPSSGDGAGQPSRVDPRTGVVDPAYKPLQETPRASTAGGLGAGDAHGDLASYRKAQAQASRLVDDGAAGFGLTGDVDTGFDTTGAVPADTNYQSTTPAGGPLVIRDDAELPADSNLQAGGRPVGM